MRAVCVLQGQQVAGVVEFEEVESKIAVTGVIRGLSDGLHGFHVHEYGDLRMGCTIRFTSNMVDLKAESGTWEI